MLLICKKIPQNRFEKLLVDEQGEGHQQEDRGEEGYVCGIQGRSISLWVEQLVRGGVGLLQGIQVHFG